MMTVPFQKEIQPQNLYIAENVDAQTDSKLRLPGGNKEPRWYSLGSQSTVPFVQFLGGGAVQKIFTWGEMVQVPPGQEVVVKNASLMRGDIIIVSGQDPVARPRRITVPVGMIDQNGDVGGPLGSGWTDFSVQWTITPEFPCDTRNCHEAYLDLLMIGGDKDLTSINVFVFYQEFIHTYTGPVVPVAGPGVWIKLDILPPNTVSYRIPIGINQYMGNWTSEPQSLLDKADFQIFNGVAVDAVGVIYPTGFYTLNY